MALHHPVRQCRQGPFPQAPQTLGKSPFARGVIRLPHPLLDLRKCVAQCFGGSITDFEKRMEKTQDHRDMGAQGLPSALRGLPAIGIDSLRRLIGIHGLSFAGKHAIRFFQGSLGGCWGNGCSQDTALSYGGGDVNPLALQPAMFFIGHQVLG